MKYIILLIIFFISCNRTDLPLNLIPLELEELCELDDELKEISGLTSFNSDYYAISDSGSKNAIYNINLSCTSDERIVMEVENVDWEAVSEDNDFIYIGDFGNNFGSRKDLKVLKIAKDKVANDSIPVSTILNFEYKFQLSYEMSDSHNWDCEAMISMGNELHLFSKNRENNKTNLYILQKNSDFQEIVAIDSFEIESLVTEALYRQDKDQLLLLSYVYNGAKFNNQLTFINNYSEMGLGSTNSKKVYINNSLQLESMVMRSDDELLLASEAETFGKAKLFTVDISDF